MKLLAVLLAALAFFSVERVQAAPAPDSFPGCVYQASPPTLNDLTNSRLNCDTNGALKISGNITSSSASVGLTGSAVPTSADFIGGNKAGNLTGLILDASGYLDINCQAGCAGGSFNNNTDAVATSATNGQSASWLYGFNGATWDRLRVDGSKNLDVNINASSATVPVSGTFFQATQPISVSALPLPAGAATAAIQTGGSQKTQIVDGSGNVIASTTNALNVQCANCASASAVDKTTFTSSTTIFSADGGFFQTTATNNPLTNLQQGMAQMTAYRAFMMNLRDSSGNEEGLSGQPLQVSLANTGANATALLVNQPTAANFNATVVGTGTFLVQAAQALASSLNATVVGAGTAGTANAGVETIQGIASMTPVLTNPGTAANWAVGATAGAVPANAVYVGGNKSGNLVGLLLDASSYLDVNCQTGCAGGSFNNNTDAVATSATNGQSAAWLYGFNGTTFDRLRVDGSKNLNVDCAAGCSGTTAVDMTTFTPGVTNTGTAGGFFQTTVTNNALTNLQQGMVQMTATRAFFTNLRNASGAEEGIAALPFQVSLANTGVNGTPVSISLAASTVASGAYVAGALADGADTTLGSKTDAKNSATDATSITAMQVLKEISAVEQAPVSRAVTNVGTFATQSAITAASGSIASGAVASGAIASGAVASGAFASGSISDGAEVTLGTKADAKSTATDTTAITIMQVLKEISFMAQTPAALPANQSMNEAQINAVTPLMGNGVTGTGSQRVTIASDNTQNSNPWLVTPGVTTITASITRPANTTAYTANTALANSTSSPTAGGFTLTSACRASGGFGTITDVTFSSSAKTAYQGSIFVFNQAATAINDDASFTISTADVLNLVTVIPFNIGPGYLSNAVTGVGFTTGVNVGYTCVGTANLRFLVEITNTPTPASAEVFALMAHVVN